jgi:hypothetical protein
MNTKLRYAGLDVHAETITAAVAEFDGEVRSCWSFGRAGSCSEPAPGTPS